MNALVDYSSSSSSDNDSDNHNHPISLDERPNKKLKSSPVKEENDNILPRPTIHTNDGDDWMGMPKDYLADEPSLLISNNEELSEKLSNLHSQFAMHIKSQKEFGNPHLFPSIIQHFQIEWRGSNIPENNKFQRFEYIEKLTSKEEQIRITSQQQPPPN